VSIALAAGSTPASAASLQIAPVGLEIVAPGAAAVLTLRNEGERPLNAQIRVFRWVQVDGEEKLIPTEDVVASPPAATLKPKANYTVRIVRVGGGAVVDEESYRLVIDELPDARRKDGATIKIVLRHSIPVFFEPAGYSDPRLTWSVKHDNGRSYVVASNAGDRRARISRLRLKDAKGTVVSFGDGLTGYVLGHSSMRWAIPRGAKRLDIKRPIAISSVSDLGPIEAKSASEGAR
jgi:fimbrial chaperone protein